MSVGVAPKACSRSSLAPGRRRPIVVGDSPAARRMSLGKLPSVRQWRGAPVSTDVMALIRELASERNGQDVTPETRLLDVGFDSLACAEFAAQVQERYGLDIADGEVTRASTAGELATVVDGA